MPQDNPIKSQVAEFLCCAESAISEHELIKYLERQGQFPSELAELGNELRCFKQHFLVMNALYQLQRDYQAENLLLSISPLAIELKTATTVNVGTLSLEYTAPALSEFYLDWRNYTLSEEAVGGLLKGFWSRYVTSDERGQALLVLGLDASAKWRDVEKAYKRLAQLRHPDRGGSTQEFQRLNRAYQTLKKCK